MSQRSERISDEFQKALSEAIRTLKDPRVHEAMVSVTRCEVTGDLRYAKAYISVFGSDDLDADGGLKVQTRINDDQSLSTSLITTRQIDDIIAEASEYFTLKMGDMIVIGSDNEGHSLSIGEHLSGTINEKDSLTIRIK